jgi:hypothetical protein
MALKNPMVQQALALFGYGVGVGLRSTLDVRAVYSDPTVDPVHPDYRGRHVYAVLHETLLLPILVRSDPRMVTLASESGDGEIIARTLKYFGWASARGSTSRGGAAAILRFLRTDDRSPNLTVDGPRGPRRVMSPGAIFLASKLDLPMVCVGVGCSRPWRLRSWDRFAIPKPYSRIRFVFGPKRRVPAGLEREGLEGYRLWFENHLNWLTTEAEAWAESGRRRTGEIPMEPGEMSPPMPHWDPAHAVKLPDSMNQAWAALPPGKKRAA